MGTAEAEDMILLAGGEGLPFADESGGVKEGEAGIWGGYGGCAVR